jgi:hypothetical protein
MGRQNQRIVVTHDRATLPAFAFERVVAGEPMPGVFMINDRLPVGRAIEVATCSEASEWEGRVLYLPLYISMPRSDFAAAAKDFALNTRHGSHQVHFPSVGTRCRHCQ